MRYVFRRRYLVVVEAGRGGDGDDDAVDDHVEVRRSEPRAEGRPERREFGGGGGEERIQGERKENGEEKSSGRHEDDFE